MTPRPVFTPIHGWEVALHDGEALDFYGAFNVAEENGGKLLKVTRFKVDPGYEPPGAEWWQEQANRYFPFAEKVTFARKTATGLRWVNLPIRPAPLWRRAWHAISAELCRVYGFPQRRPGHGYLPPSPENTPMSKYTPLGLAALAVAAIRQAVADPELQEQVDAQGEAIRAVQSSMIEFSGRVTDLQERINNNDAVDQEDKDVLNGIVEELGALAVALAGPADDDSDNGVISEVQPAENATPSPSADAAVAA